MPELQNLWDIIKDIQAGNCEAVWKFINHHKIQCIIKARISDYRKMYHWLPAEDLDDIEFGLTPRLIELVKSFTLPKVKNEGKVVSYFSLRILGEADFLLTKITGMRQDNDAVTGQSFFRLNTQCYGDDFDQPSKEISVDNTVIEKFESNRLRYLFNQFVYKISKDTNDLFWLQCYVLKLCNYTWKDIAEKLKYTNTDYFWLKNNTHRFITRLKDRLVHMGEKPNCKICGIYTDCSDIALTVIDGFDDNTFQIWSKHYDTYEDLDKFELRLSDLFRQYDGIGGITYIVTNEPLVENRALVILMRYLTKRESLVEYIDTGFLRNMYASMRNKYRGVDLDDAQKWSLLLALTKKSLLELIREKATK